MEYYQPVERGSVSAERKAAPKATAEYPSSGEWRLVSYAFDGGDNMKSPPRVILQLEDESGTERFATRIAECQFDALLQCAAEIARRDLVIRAYDARTDWTKAGPWTDGVLTLEHDGSIVKTSGCSTNAVHAFVTALVRALNARPPTKVAQSART